MSHPKAIRASGLEKALLSGSSGLTMHSVWALMTKPNRQLVTPKWWWFRKGIVLPPICPCFRFRNFSNSIICLKESLLDTKQFIQKQAFLDIILYGPYPRWWVNVVCAYPVVSDNACPLHEPCCAHLTRMPGEGKVQVYQG